MFYLFLCDTVELISTSLPALDHISSKNRLKIYLFISQYLLAKYIEIN